MNAQSWHVRSAVVRLGGAMLLLGAWRIADAAVTLGRGDAGHEPMSVYGLCLLAFLCASAGAASLANGASLFGKVPMGELWTPHHDTELVSYQSEPHARPTPKRGE